VNERSCLSSNVNWAVLGLLIERPNYIYAVAQRFEDRYGDVLGGTSSRIYEAFKRLERDGLIEPMDDVAAVGSPRQPKVHYRATGRGARAWRQEFAARLGEDSQRSALLSRVLAASAFDDARLVMVLDSFEQQLLDQRATLDVEESAVQPGSGVDFGQRLVNEYERTLLHAKFMFIDWARSEIAARAKAPRSKPADDESADDDESAVA
jgi:DNA-binding PadR family transcriptional regulator